MLVWPFDGILPFCCCGIAEICVPLRLLASEDVVDDDADVWDFFTGLVGAGS